MPIKPIETLYKGYRFRSRLEARWAVFFDAIVVRWEYEKQGFELGEQGCYLPDFWIEDWRKWVEIKPTLDDVGESETQRLVEFSRRIGPLLLMVGSPWPGELQIFEMCRFMDFEPPWIWGEIASCRKCNGHCLLADDEIHHNGSTGFMMLGRHADCDTEKYPISGSLLPAYQAARSARFEHGERPS